MIRAAMFLFLAIVADGKKEAPKVDPRFVNSGFEQSHFRGFARATLEYHGQHFFATNPPVT